MAITRTMTTTTTFEQRRMFDSTSLTNGNGTLAGIEKAAPASRFWAKIRVNEWTFSLMLFAFSLAIVLAKLYVNYADSGKFLNASNQYAEVATDVLATFYGKYGWLLKATMSGLVITGFTWFILYKDSSEPGVNPPSPFSPSKQRIRGSSRIQINYLVGVLNGILCFVYMCL
ncbi:ADP-ribosylation factor-like protein 6-interacting protein 6 isoform X2 [Solenopsis invicta]|uniref:ADP-ribosylation factor-like protein 6-interacting protein 6 isoform X2 n=1 Tax=Solenopsis invicta TaxID=13686 RepID=UPI000595A21B|nr:ADP-ribosylation factor-like protein 6-interacting protein 6 isoform X2 [Solenopsis invicta]